MWSNRISNRLYVVYKGEELEKKKSKQLKGWNRLQLKQILKRRSGVLLYTNLVLKRLLIFKYRCPGVTEFELHIEGPEGR